MVDRDVKYKRIKAHMEKKVLERTNNIKLSVDEKDEYEKSILHGNYLQKCSKDELIKIILDKEKLSKSDSRRVDKGLKSEGHKKKMDFKKYELCKMALKITYIGANYGGLVVQQNEPNTVEQAILNTLKKVCLIDPNEKSIWSVQLNRCGRTDKGVSALCNVLSLVIRKLPDEDYLQRINRCLPTDIRVLAYAYTDESFDSRFSCVYREYNYFFF